jgi:Ni,Fe-hydrogenase III small subunit/formate hydrogenlyase subunit 6/NADH:ubiquinone oxidoreductase subunit I
MWRIFQARFQQGHRTMKYPDGPAPPLPDRLRGRPVVDADRCEAGCRVCVEACPTDALSRDVSAPTGALSLDLGRCIFCTTCVESCPTGAITQDASEYRLAARTREALVVDPSAPIEVAEAALDTTLRRLFGRSLRLRQVSAGGCNACEADTNVLGTVGWDLSRFGIQFVASPRHADGLFITGPVSTNMQLALHKTWEALPAPRIVIATGACAISGGLYRGHPETRDGAGGQVPIDLFIPGCPPHPLTILDGLLRMLGRIEAEPGRIGK